MTRCHVRLINKLPAVIFRTVVGIVPPVVCMPVHPLKFEEPIALSLFASGFVAFKIKLT